MAFWDAYPPRQTVGERKRAAERELAKRRSGTGAALTPVVLGGRKIAASVWGKAWCDNLERYRDYAHRLERGRSYVRSGAVIDLQIERGRVRGLVVGSDTYEIAITIAPVAPPRWRVLADACAGSVASLLELLQGKLDEAVMGHICAHETGLFPMPSEIDFDCSCPDSASMCKHVAAVLYGVGARFDAAPDLLFVLRHVAANDLIATTATVRPSTSERSLAVDDDLAALFGVELDTPSPPATKAKTKTKSKTKTKTKSKSKTKTKSKTKSKTKAKTKSK